MRKVILILALYVLMLSSCTAQGGTPAGSDIAAEVVEPTVEPTAEPAPEPTPTPPLKPKTFEELAPTTLMSFEELVGDNGDYKTIERYPEPDRYRVVIDLYYQVVLVYSRDESGAYTVPERYMVCTSGGREDHTPTGVFKAGTHRPRFGKFEKDKVYGQYWTQIVRNIYFHSLLYSQRSASTYTASSYRLLSKRGSHGCVRLLVPDACWIHYNIGPGAEIEVRRGSKSDTDTAAIKEKLTRAPLPDSRPKLSAGNIPNTDTWSIETLRNELARAEAYVLPDGTYIYPGMETQEASPSPTGTQTPALKPTVTLPPKPTLTLPFKENVPSIEF